MVPDPTAVAILVDVPAAVEEDTDCPVAAVPVTEFPAVVEAGVVVVGSDMV